MLIPQVYPTAPPLTVHEIRLSTAIRANNAGEIKERPNALLACVGLEILQFEVGYRHGVCGWCVVGGRVADSIYLYYLSYDAFLKIHRRHCRHGLPS